MELLTLDSNYQPFELVERYASLIWTERYSKAGDFQLVTTDVQRMLKLLPLESAVTIRESTVPMLVEAHKIEKSITGAPVLTVTGRSFETVLERRVVAQLEPPLKFYEEDLRSTKIPWFEEESAKESDAAYQVLRKILGDVERPLWNLDGNVDTTRPPLSSVDQMFSLNDAFPMVDLTLPRDYVYLPPPVSDDNLKYEIKPGNLYAVIMELLTTNKHHGLKAVRPTGSSNKIGIEIYNGADLTKPGTSRVVFDAKFDQFEGSTYLLSRTGSANIAYVFSKTNSSEVLKNRFSESNEPTGLDRRVLYVDVSSEDGANTLDMHRTRGLIELYKHNVTAFFDGQLSQQLATGYNRQDGGYFLGDIIRLDGEYGLSQNVRVSEFIRSEDNTGSKAYPTFEEVTE